MALCDPSYDLPTRTATCEVAVLAEWQRRIEAGFTEATSDPSLPSGQALAELLPSFGAAHVFIDGCPDGDLTGIPDAGTG